MLAYTTCGGLGFPLKGVGFVPDVGMAPPKFCGAPSLHIPPSNNPRSATALAVASIKLEVFAFEQ